MRWLALLWLVFGVLWSAPAWGQAAPATQRSEAEASSRELTVPTLTPGADSGPWLGKPVERVLLTTDGEPEPREIELRSVPRGQPFSSELARLAMRELLETGEYASVEAEVREVAGGIEIVLHGIVRRIVADVQILGGTLDFEGTLRTAGIAVGEEVTRPELARVAARVWQLYRARGFPSAQVSGRWLSTDEPRRVVVILDIQPGPAETISALRFRVQGPSLPTLWKQFESFPIREGQRADEERATEAAQALEEELRRKGWHEAHVSSRFERSVPGRVELVVLVEPHPFIRIRFEGNRTFDSVELLEALNLEEEENRSKEALKRRIVSFYEERGFFDVQVTIVELSDPVATELLFQIRENTRLVVMGREFPCLSGPRTSEQLNEEIDGFISEALPGGDEIVAPVDSAEIDRTLAPSHAPSTRAEPYLPNPVNTYSPQVYARALEHVRDLYRSEGYLSAVVGPVTVLRRRCDVRSSPGHCIPVGYRTPPETRCPSQEEPFPEEDAEAGDLCVPDPLRGITCESTVVLSIPVKLGPRTMLWDVQFEGNERIADARLLEAAELQLGEPVSRVKLQQARRRILDNYGNLGFAFANVDVDLELSGDHTLGRATFVISEREPVRIRGFVVRGAERTSHGLILSRLDLEQGGLYQSDLVRLSEEQLATLGVFSSVTIGLEDPEVPAREKIVVVSVSELPPQYVDVRPGLSTGEGIRGAFEYGHRNLMGRAVQMRFRVQLGYLPDFFIFDDQVRENFNTLSFSNRLERRNTLTFEFPVAKKYRLAIDGVDVRDNSRDFGITKRAGIVTVTHRASRTLSLVAGSSIELNDARIFGETQTLQTYLEANPQQARLLNVPEGRSFAIALRAGGAWDLRDNPLGATRGFFASVEAEPVVAFLDEDSAAVQLDQCAEAGQDPATCEFKSRFLRTTQRIAGYIPFTERGLSLALSVRVGANFQLVENSSTYPDRLFFLGGGDSLRGFLQASVIPEDIAEQLVEEDPNAPDDDQRLTASKVVIRGGDFLLNPRAELRIPLSKIFHTAVFLDTGNVWREIDNVNPTVLRYTAGSGLRAITPIGPLAFDYGFKLDRRFFEDDIGAFHFSVGLF